MEILVTERDNGTRRVQIRVTGESKVEQSHKKACDINTIMAKANKTGLFPRRTDRPRYGDFVGTKDFHEALNRVRNAQEEFLLLPSDIRARFENDPGQLVEFLSDPENRSEAEDLGLVPRPESAHEPIVVPEPKERPSGGSHDAVEPAGDED